ncbi:MAG: glycogen/starch synthase [Bacteroidales bacterium]|nr:glycogen/starch synthase [Bacteroidales bacterium]
MEKVRVLYVTQEMVPYMRESQMAIISRYLPQGTQEKGKEIRTFMPRFGLINERRHQLHEVIRLSGINIIINETDHPLIIKVASIQQARMQVYFIDSEDFFKRKFYLHDENNKFFVDNDERAVFFSRGTLETVKKLGWAPDIVHLHGWMSLLVAPYLKEVYAKHPLFSETKVIISLYDDHFEDPLSENIANTIAFDDLTIKKLPHLQQNPSYISLVKDTLNYCDGIIITSSNVLSEIVDYAQNLNVPVLTHTDEDNYIEIYNQFYDKIFIPEAISF